VERAGYTIRIFVADGDPEGIRVIDKMNWTGTGIVFPRRLWSKVKNRTEFDRAGVYILVGYGEADEELPRIYVGEGDGIRARIDQHHQKKEFWNWAISFTSNSGALNKAHVQWLEYALVQYAKESGQCVLDNGNVPLAPALSEHEKADLHGFLDQMLQILPLVYLRAFEKPKAVAVPNAAEKLGESPKERARPDTIVVPAQREGFERVFLGEHAWHAVRIAGAMLDKIKYCAVYQSHPVSAVTHVAPVKQIEPYGDSGKYRLVFAEAPTNIGPLSSAGMPSGSMQGPRYTTYAKLKAAKKVADLF
jgi:hypothetical protein